MNTELKFGIGANYGNARERLIQQRFQERKANSKNSLLQDSSHRTFAERDVDKLQNEDQFSYEISIDMMHVLNQIDEALQNPQLVDELQKEMDKCKLHELDEFANFLSDKDFPDEVQQEITSYLLFRSRLEIHNNSKK